MFSLPTNMDPNHQLYSTYPPFTNSWDTFENISELKPYHTTKPMEKWENKEVLQFIQENILGNNYSECFQNNDFKFQSVSGYIFKNLDLVTCQKMAGSETLGQNIYQNKEQYLENVENCSKVNTMFLEDAVPNDILLDIDDLDAYIPFYSEQLNAPLYDYNSSPESSRDIDWPIYGPSSPDSDENHTLIRRPGRPRNKNKLKRCEKRSERLWEFLINLLEDSNTCPKLIRWENFGEGTFKFVQNEQVAQIWGNRKKNENMTYEKFSRAMRYYYKSQILQPVPGKRLVYKFGPHAKGWNKKMPIC